MRIGLIGCGRVGTTLLYYLKKTNTITGVYDINKEHQKRTSRILKAKANSTLEEICKQSRVLIFATPDDAIPTAFRAARPFITGKKYLFHCSGLLPARIFPKAKDIYRAAIHPFATFPMIMIPPPRRHYIMYIEGDTRAIAVAQKTFRNQHFSIRRLHTRNRTDYHLIGIFSSALFVGLHAAIKRLARKLRWGEKEFRDNVYPIINETITNIHTLGIEQSLSGPIQRGDYRTIKKHLQRLRNDRELLMIYTALSRMILETLPPGKQKREIKKLFS